MYEHLKDSRMSLAEAEAILDDPYETDQDKLRAAYIRTGMEEAPHERDGGHVREGIGRMIPKAVVLLGLIGIAVAMIAIHEVYK